MKSQLILRIFLFLITRKNVLSGYGPINSDDVPCFDDLPESVKVVYIDPETLIKYDNKGQRVMGVSDDKCDNGKVRSLSLRKICLKLHSDNHHEG